MRSGLVLSLLFLPLYLVTAKVYGSWLVGVGKSDITGPIADVVMLGYTDTFQVAAGLHDRLWARAYIISESADGPRVAIVVISAAMIFDDVKREVIRRLQLRYGSHYQTGNVLIVADHSHSAPGGQSFHFLFAMGVRGFERDAWEAQVNGIVQAIELAHDSLAPGRVLINRGELFNASANRSIKAWLKNPEAALLPSVDPEMLVMRFDQGEKPIGMLGWFATHGVSFPMSNKLVSGDNKSYAAWLMEQEQGEGFVAAFPQTNAGDMTPNLYGDGTGPGRNPEENARIIGQRQYVLGSHLMHSAHEELSGSLDWRHEYVDFGKMTVSPSLTGFQEAVDTCPPAAGYAFAAGTPDGRPFPMRWIFWGKQNQGFWPITTISDYFTGRTSELELCHSPKPIVLGMGTGQKYEYLNYLLSSLLGGSIPPQAVNHSWIPQLMPVSIMKIGPLGLLGVPAEFTIVAGRRLKQSVGAVAKTGLEHLLLAGYANDYSFYVATPEEYQEQLYEGGATLYGRWTLPAYQQVFTRLAENLAAPESCSLSVDVPEDLSIYYRDIQAPVINCKGKFGDHGRQLSYVPDTFWNGQTVQTCFTASHPRLAGRNLNTFLTVEKYDDVSEEWNVIADDDSWDTRLYWYSSWFGNTAGYVCIEWTPPLSQKAGFYQIGHHGLWRENDNDELVAYHGYSRRFQLVREVKIGVVLLKARQDLAEIERVRRSCKADRK